MYNIREIKLQNQQDCFSWLYLYLANECREAYGRNADGIIYSAVHQFGWRLGKQAEEKLIAAGNKPNLKELAECGADTFLDPRMVVRPLCITEQVLKTETYLCPLANLWKEAGKGELGSMFCEEFYAGYFDGFSDGKAQTNVSKMITSDTDCHCKHSVYYRPANVNEDKRNQVFTMDECSAELQAECRRTDFPVMESGMSQRCCLLIQSFFDVAVESGQPEAKTVIASALRKLGTFLADWMIKQAKISEWKLNKTFLKMNLPFPVDLDCVSNFFSEELKEIMVHNFYAAFYQGIGEV